MIKSRLVKMLLVPLLALGGVMATSSPASAWPNPADNGCLGGTIRASQHVYAGSTYLGHLRIYQSCGSNFHAYLTTGGTPRTLGVEIWSHDWTSAWRSMNNGYAVWTDMVPGGCVYAQVNYYGSWYGWVQYQCAW